MCRIGIGSWACRRCRAKESMVVRWLDGLKVNEEKIPGSDPSETPFSSSGPNFPIPHRNPYDRTRFGVESIEGNNLRFY